LLQIVDSRDDTAGRVHRRRKNINSGQIDRKKTRKTATRNGKAKVDESTDQELTSSHQQITGQRQNSSMAGEMNRRSGEQNHKRGNSSYTAAAAADPSKHTAQNRTAMADPANVPRRLRRSRRGLLDNKIDVSLPEDDIEQPDRDRAPAVDPPRLSLGLSLLHGRKSHRTVESSAGSIHTNHENSEQSVFDTGNRRNENARGRRRNSRVRGWRRKQSSLMTLLRNPDDRDFSDRRRLMAANGTCKKKRLRVNFADIGWGEWIIAPDFFDAYYCDGSCSFPIARVSQQNTLGLHCICFFV